MNPEESPLESLLHKATDYGKSSIELIKLKSIDKTTDFVSSFLSRLTIILVLTIFTFFINIGLAVLIGDMLGKIYYGFFIVGSFYALIALILYLFRHQLLKHPICNYIIKQLLKF